MIAEAGTADGYVLEKSSAVRHTGRILFGVFMWGRSGPSLENAEFSVEQNRSE